MIYNLDDEIKPCDVIKLTIKDKEYIIPLEVSDSLAYWLAENMDKLSNVIGSNGTLKLSKDTIDFAVEIVSQLFKENYPECNKEWVKKNLSFQHKVYIVMKAAIPIVLFITKLVKDFSANFSSELTNIGNA